jgi:transposase
LVNEVMRLMLNEERFTLVTAEAATQPNGKNAPVSGPNNEAERTLRGAAEARKTGRTNKTVVGARRQTVIVSVLESLPVYLPQFTLGSVVAEISHGWQTGQSCFSKLLNKMQLKAADQSVLDKVLPIPDGS